VKPSVSCARAPPQQAAQGNDVKVFLQSPLWEVARQHFWGNVPGTDTNAYYDTGHLLALGARYLYAVT
jgi:hypothetical protein